MRESYTADTQDLDKSTKCGFFLFNSNHYFHFYLSRRLSTIGWGEYGTVGGEDGTPLSVEWSPGRDKLILKVNFKFQIKGTL